jgi:hypothetical protein
LAIQLAGIQRRPHGVNVSCAHRHDFGRRMQKAKKLVRGIGGVQQAKQALVALGQLLD